MGRYRLDSLLVAHDGLQTSCASAVPPAPRLCASRAATSFAQLATFALPRPCGGKKAGCVGRGNRVVVGSRATSFQEPAPPPSPTPQAAEEASDKKAVAEALAEEKHEKQELEEEREHEKPPERNPEFPGAGVPPDGFIAPTAEQEVAGLSPKARLKVLHAKADEVREKAATSVSPAEAAAKKEANEDAQLMQANGAGALQTFVGIDVRSVQKYWRRYLAGLCVAVCLGGYSYWKIKKSLHPGGGGNRITVVAEEEPSSAAEEEEKSRRGGRRRG
eukprot:g3847.t1